MRYPANMASWRDLVGEGEECFEDGLSDDVFGVVKEESVGSIYSFETLENWFRSWVKRSRRTGFGFGCRICRGGPSRRCILQESESTSERRDHEPDSRPVIVDELWSRREGQITRRPLLNTRIYDSPVILLDDKLSARIDTFFPFSEGLQLPVQSQPRRSAPSSSSSQP
jgi:hypothetical protein